MLKQVNTARKTLVIFIVVASLWSGIALLLSDNFIGDIITIVLTIPFCGVFLWSLFSTLRRIFGNRGHLYKELALSSFNVFIFLLAFSAIYHDIGIVDTTQEGNPITRDFWLCFYYSIITFTSTGYGDFQPQGIGRALASIHALVGYLVLGIMASTSMSVIQWTAEGSGMNRGIEED